MKKFTLFICCVFISFFTFSQENDIKSSKHTFSVEVFIGGPNWAQYYWEGDKAIGPFGFQLEYRNSDKKIGFGLYSSYAETKDEDGSYRRVENSYCGSGCEGDLIDDHYETVSSFKAFRAFIIPSVYFYTTKSDNNFQFRFETGLGLKLKNYKYLFGTPAEIYYGDPDLPIALRLAINAKYEIAHNFGVSLTAAAFGGETLSLGAFYKF